MGRSHHPDPRRRAIVLALKIVLTLGLLALTIWSNLDTLREVARREPHVGLFALAFVLYMSGVLLAYLRWYFLVRAAELPFRLRDAVRLGFIGTLFNLVIPGAIGGDFVKAAYLCREQGRHARPIASVFLDRITGLLGLFLLAVIAGTAGYSSLRPEVHQLVTASYIATGVTTAILLLAFLPRGILPTHKRRFAELAAAGDAYRKRFWVVLLAVAMGTITHSLNVLAFYAVSRAIFPSVPGLTQHFLIVPLVLFSTAIPLPFGALGASEQVSLALFRLTEYQGGAVAMLGFRVLQFGGAILGAGVYLANRSQVRQLREEARRLDSERRDNRHSERESAPVTTERGSSATAPAPADR